MALSVAQPPASFSWPLRQSMLCTMDEEEDTPRLTVEAPIDRAGGGDRCPPGPQALSILDGLSVEQIQKFRSNMAMRREGRSRAAADELHHPAIGCAEIFDFHTLDHRGRPPGERHGIGKAVP